MRSVVLVDESDNQVGTMDVATAHLNDGTLHRAVSVLVCRKRGLATEMLLQQRASVKTLWPEYWSNTVCTHPLDGESYEDAAVRRLAEEMGIQTAPRALTSLYRFRYQARYDANTAEHELDTLMGMVWDGIPKPNPSEASSFRWVRVDELVREIGEHPERFTPWFRLIMSDTRTTAWCASL